MRDFLVYHEEREVHEGFGFFLIFYFPLFVLKLFFFVIFVSFVRSLYGCLSSRCKSGHGNWLFTRVVIFDIPEG